MPMATEILEIILVLVLTVWLYREALRAVRLERELMEADRLRRTECQGIMDERNSTVRAKDERYEALVESYLRETGKVYMRPPMSPTSSLTAPQPNPWRMKPPPPTNSLPEPAPLLEKGKGKR